MVGLLSWVVLVVLSNLKKNTLSLDVRAACKRKISELLMFVLVIRR